MNRAALGERALQAARVAPQRASAGHLIRSRSRMGVVREERSTEIHLERQQGREEGASVQIAQGLWATAGVAFPWVVALD